MSCLWDSATTIWSGAFGQPIGRFQAIKHLLAQTAETVEALTAAVWDAALASTDTAHWDRLTVELTPGEQAELSALVARARAFDGAVSAARDAIQARVEAIAAAPDTRAAWPRPAT